MGSNPAGGTSLRNFGNSVYNPLPVSFGGDPKICRSIISGVNARENIPQRGQLCNLSWNPPLLEKDILTKKSQSRELFNFI